jgi:chemotaxis protein MotB
VRALKHLVEENNADEVNSDGTWAISYGDMVTLLLTFFILFFSTTKGKGIESSLQTVLLKHLKAEFSEKPVPNPDAVSNTPQTGQLNSAAKQPQLTELVSLSSLGARAQPFGQSVVIDFPDLSFFKFGKAEMTNEGRRALASFARSYVPFAGSYQITIRAFTDDRPVRKLKNRLFTDNLSLSVLRALDGVRVLQKAGIPLDRMKTAGFGTLNLSREILRTIATASKEKGKGTPMSRKIVLLIEPEIRGDL